MKFSTQSLVVALSLATVKATGSAEPQPGTPSCPAGKELQTRTIDWEDVPVPFMEQITSQFSPCIIECASSVDNGCVLFNSAEPSGGDNDLGSPNESCTLEESGVEGGMGQGVAGEEGQANENCPAEPLGLMLIIQDNAEVPDDYAGGGVIDFNFSGECIFPMEVEHLDVDGSSETLSLLVGDTLIASQASLGPNALGYFSAATSTCVYSFKLVLTGSMAIPSIKYGKCVDIVNSGGDPHFQRWTQKRDSFHGECDLVLAHSKQYGRGAGFEIQARTTVDEFYSYIEALAVRVGDDIVQMEKDRFFLNGEEHTFEELPMKFGREGFKYTLDMGAVKSMSKQIELKSKNGVLVNFKIYKHYLQFSLAGDEADFGDSVGLLGEYGSGKMVGRDGYVFDDFEQFAFEWQVRPDLESNLFTTQRGPQLPFEQCRMPTAPRPARRALRGADDALFQEATAACSEVVKSEHDLNLCVDDVMMTRDIGIVEAW